MKVLFVDFILPVPGICGAQDTRLHRAGLLTETAIRAAQRVDSGEVLDFKCHGAVDGHFLIQSQAIGASNVGIDPQKH